jgi:hypothetical protein
MPIIAGLVIAIILLVVWFFGGFGGFGNGGDGNSQNLVPPPSALEPQPTEHAKPPESFALEIIVKNQEYYISGKKLELDAGVIPAIQGIAEKSGAKIKIVCEGARENQYRKLIEACKTLGVNYTEQDC